VYKQIKNSKKVIKMTDVNLDATNAGTSDITDQVMNLVYVVFHTFVSFLPLILILGIAAGFIMVVGKIINASKGLGK
jgi:hypothetical protein